MSLNVPGMEWMQSQWSNIMVQHSVYAAVVFLIVAHPETFKFVDGLLRKVGVGSTDKNIQLLIHAVVFALLMYFGTTMVFDPFVSQIGQVVSGFKNKKNNKNNKNVRKPATKGAKKPVPQPVRS